jgi:exodeoxyribonuclease VII large subunit
MEACRSLASSFLRTAQEDLAAHDHHTMNSEQRKVFSLLQVSRAVKHRIEDAAGGGSFWIKAEIASIKMPRHAYLELVEHRNGVKVAVMRGIIWNSALVTINQALGDERGNILREGAEILFRASLSYNEVYGLSLQIDEVDLAYSLGELERRKKETIDTLKREGLWDLNRFVPMPMVLQRIALISSIGTAAYEDFMQHLDQNEYGYRYHVRVFASIVQGDGAAKELRAALERIDPRQFDAIVMVRGGGSKLDLEAFNDLELCRMVARMPIPVMTGIGHDVDVSVVDMIARSPHKTPTAIADFLVDRSLFFETALSGFLVNIQNTVLEAFSERKEMLGRYIEMLQVRPVMQCQTRRGALQTAVGQFARQVTEKLVGSNRLLDGHVSNLAVLPRHKLSQIETAKVRAQATALEGIAHRGFQVLLSRINGMQEAIQLLSPDRLMLRGFSITRYRGVAITDPTTMSEGERIETTFAKGTAWSTITKIERHGG